MTFVADESVDRQIVEAVRSLGYEVLSIAETTPGMRDEEVLSRARNSRAVLVTGDKDFGELVFRQKQIHNGIVLFRLAGVAPAAKAHVMKAAIKAHASELESGFCVVTDRAVRIRRSRQ